ncbi:MAG: phosphatidate cytidylyltransferase [Candidatus Acidiferrales bacterium]
MLLRILTAVILIPAIVAVVWYGPYALVAALAAVVAILALRELFALGDRHGLRGFRKWTCFCAALMFYAQYSIGLAEKHTLEGGLMLVRSSGSAFLTVEMVILIFFFGCVGIGIATRRPLPEILPAIAISAAGLHFIVFPFSFVVRINEIEPHGRALLLFTLALVWAGDSAAYFVGKSLGRIPMAPALSPKKTWEGAFANLIASLIVGYFFARWLQIDLLTMLIITAFANIAGQMGDLIESAYKRGAAVKDSGSILPGHGGMLDRVDALILAVPVVWALYLLIILGAS